MSTAAFKVVKLTGVNGATETDTSENPGWLSADVHDANPSNHQVGVPDAVSSPNYSYECQTAYKCTVAPNKQCVNFKYFGPAVQPDADDTPGNKMTVYAGTTEAPVTPTNSASSVATTVQHSNYFGPGAGEYLAIGVVPDDDMIDAVGEYTHCLVTQLKVEDQAQRGAIATVPYSIEYDES